MLLQKKKDSSYVSFFPWTEIRERAPRKDTDGELRGKREKRVVVDEERERERERGIRMLSTQESSQPDSPSSIDSQGSIDVE